MAQISQKIQTKTHIISVTVKNTKSQFKLRILVMTASLEQMSITSVIKWRTKYVHLRQV